MTGKQHIGLRCRLLGLLFLFFNCICTAAPVIKATSEDYKQAVSLRLSQNPNAAESEEESRLAIAYVVQLTYFSLKRQPTDRLWKMGNNHPAVLLPDMGECKAYIAGTNFLPRPAYYAFLFRYKLF